MFLAQPKNCFDSSYFKLFADDYSRKHTGFCTVELTNTKKWLNKL